LLVANKHLLAQGLGLPGVFFCFNLNLLKGFKEKKEKKKPHPGPGQAGVCLQRATGREYLKLTSSIYPNLLKSTKSTDSAAFHRVLVLDTLPVTLAFSRAHQHVEDPDTTRKHWITHPFMLLQFPCCCSVSTQQRG
jgi:hypothetical protein